MIMQVTFDPVTNIQGYVINLGEPVTALSLGKIPAWI